MCHQVVLAINRLLFDGNLAQLIKYFNWAKLPPSPLESSLNKRLMNTCRMMVILNEDMTRACQSDTAGMNLFSCLTRSLELERTP